MECEGRGCRLGPLERVQCELRLGDEAAAAELLRGLGLPGAAGAGDLMHTHLVLSRSHPPPPPFPLIALLSLASHIY